MQENRDGYGNNGTLIPIVCRACGGVQRLSLVTLQTRRDVKCGACKRALDVDGITSGLPKVVSVDAPMMAAKAVSEFP